MEDSEGSRGSSSALAARRSPAIARRATCPSWCVVGHGVRTGEDDDLHVGEALLVKQTVMRLCATIDRRTGAVDGPHVMLGTEEYSLHEAKALSDALTRLVERGSELSRRARA